MELQSNKGKGKDLDGGGEEDGLGWVREKTRQTVDVDE